MNIGIIGYGFVGQAQHSIIKNEVGLVIYDLNKKKYERNDKLLTECNMIFICVPTPNLESGYQNSKYVTDWLDYFVNHRYQGIVVIKSTILHSHIEKYTDELNLCYNPEFLNQNTSYKDVIEQNTIILGGEPAVTREVKLFYSNHTYVKSSNYEFMTIKEASDFKYTRNLYGAYKVLFWEFIQDTTGNSRKMSDLYMKMDYQSEMSQVGMDGFRGFGGTCFPKDLIAWEKEHNHDLTKFMIKYNKSLHS